MLRKRPIRPADWLVIWHRGVRMSQATSSVSESSKTRSFPLKLLPARSFGETNRTGLWWLQPLVVFLGLGGFVVYSTWAAFQGIHYRYGPYISPFYSPDLFGD